MVEDTDGIEEAFEGQVRVLVTAAGQVAERLARAREQALRRAEAHSEQQARQMRSRLEAERHAARAELAGVYRKEWWDRATPEQIGHACQVARVWAQEDPEAVRAEQRMREELRTRYGIDADNTGAPAAAVQAALERAERDRTHAGTERTREQADRAEAHRLTQDADRQDRLAAEARSAASLEADPDERLRAAREAEQRDAKADHLRSDGRAMYDTAERRQVTARQLEAKGIDPELVATRMRVDTSQGAPATEASKGRGKAPKARRSTVRAAQRQRTGLDR